jgi:2-amino-4-hydroxy-6-hydroxymethyldihydropteridine diphosphokinase
MELALSLGSNLGDRLAYLRGARDRVAALPGVTLVAQAPVYETEPVGVKAEHAHLAYLNTVLIIATARPLDEVHRDLAQIETELGRVRGADRFAPRTMDIDILFAGDTEQRTEQLSVPHPRWAQRRFVVQPLCDVRPDLHVPGARATVRDVLARLPPGEGLTLLTREW